MIEAKLYLTGVILLLAGIFIGATFKTGVDEAIHQLNIGCSVHPDLRRKLLALGERESSTIASMYWVHTPHQHLPLLLVVHTGEGENEKSSPSPVKI